MQFIITTHCFFLLLYELRTLLNKKMKIEKSQMKNEKS